MNASNWKRLQKVNEYLEARKKKGVEGFKQVIKQLESESVTWAVVIFSYENMEVHVRANGGDTLFDSLDTLNNYELDDIKSYEYDDQNALADFIYSTSSDMASKLVELWVMECFHQALQNIQTNIPFYYKANHDDLEVLELRTGKTWFEKTEFQTYIDNNLSNTIELVRS